jgi:hypothetical protein
VNEPGEIVQRSGLKNADAARGTFCPMTLRHRLGGILASSAFRSKRLCACHNLVSIIGN